MWSIYTVCTCAHTHSLTHSTKKLGSEKTKTPGLRELENRGGVLIERRVSRRAARAGNAAALFFSHWVIGSHSISGIIGVGPSPSLHSSCICLSTRRPLPLSGTDRQRGEKRGGGGGRGSHTQNKSCPY